MEELEQESLFFICLLAFNNFPIGFHGAYLNSSTNRSTFISYCFLNADGGRRIAAIYLI